MTFFNGFYLFLTVFRIAAQAGVHFETLRVDKRNTTPRLVKNFYLVRFIYPFKLFFYIGFLIII